MAKCKNCGVRVADNYDYCKECYYKLGQPKGHGQRPHKCRKCGTTISNRYAYCATCAKMMKFY